MIDNTCMGAMHIVITVQSTVEQAVYYGRLGSNHKCLDYQGVLIFQVSLYVYDKALFWILTKCTDSLGG